MKKENIKEAKWSGGTTSELYIYPQDGNYKKQLFDFRISSAKVMLEHSEFTSLPGVNRWIMSLSEPLKIVHKGIQEKILNPFECHAFEGGWTTESYGQVVDFNLMTQNGYSGDLERVITSEEIIIKEQQIGFFLLKGTLLVNGSVIHPGDFIFFENEINTIIKCSGVSQFIKVTIKSP